MIEPKKDHRVLRQQMLYKSSLLIISSLNSCSVSLIHSGNCFAAIFQVPSLSLYILNESLFPLLLKSISYHTSFVLNTNLLNSKFILLNFSENIFFINFLLEIYLFNLPVGINSL